MIRRLSQQRAIVQWKIFKEKGQAWNWMSYYRKFKDFTGKMQTNYQFRIQVRYQKQVW